MSKWLSAGSLILKLINSDINEFLNGTSAHIIQILTGAKVNTEKLCPEAVWCCRGPKARGEHCTTSVQIFQCWSTLTVDICFVISLTKIHDRVCTLPYRPIQTRNSHTFNLTSNICCNFCQQLYYFRILKFFKVYKRQKKTTYKRC